MEIKRNTTRGNWRKRTDSSPGLDQLPTLLSETHPNQATLLVRSHQHTLFHFLSKAIRICQFRTDLLHWRTWSLRPMAFRWFRSDRESGALAPTELSSSAKSLLKILSGKECRLWSKDARIFHKKRNVPVVLIANQLPLPRSINIPERFFLMHFQQHIHELKEGDSNAVGLHQQETQTTLRFYITPVYFS